MRSPRWLWLVFTVLTAASILLITRPALAALGPQEFLLSPGAAAFKTGNYDEALVGFQTLLEEHPDDVLVLRYVAISYDRLGRHEEAIATFAQALKIAPENPALHFFLGVTYFKMRETDEAIAALETSIAKGPETSYAPLARQLLDKIALQKAEYKQGGAPEQLEVDVQVGVQFDENVPAAPDEAGDESDYRAFESLSIDYIITPSNRWQIKALFSTYQSQHFQGGTDDFDLSVFEPGVEASYVTTFWNRPFEAGIRYAFDLVGLDRSRFSRSHTVTTSLGLQVNERVLATLLHTISFDEFDDDGFDPTFSSRDAINNAFGTTEYIFIDGQSLYGFAGYSIQKNSAEGANFDLSGYKFLLGGSAALPLDVRLDLNAEYAIEDYFNFASIKDRETRRTEVSAALSRPLAGDLAGTISYSFTDEDSNFEALEFMRQLLTFTVSYRFWSR